MASSSSSLFFPLCFYVLCIFFTFSNAQISASSQFSLNLPVTKDHDSLQYLTTFSYGTPFVPTNLVLDMGGSTLWVDCSSRNTPSSSLSSIPHRSIRCITAKSHEIETQSWLSSLSTPEDKDQPCQILSQNSITGTKASEGELVKDLMSLSQNQEVLFACSPSPLLKGLASGAKGMVGLGRSRSSFTSQVFDSLSMQRKITLCLSSSSGVVSFGNMVNNYESESEIHRSLTFTPLVTNKNQNKPSPEYLINVNSIKIGGKKVSFNTPSLSQDQEGNGGGGGTLLSTVVPYTTMDSSIYANFESAYLKAALSMNMNKVESVAPFGLCFSSKGIDNSQVGPSVPVIDLVLQSEMVKWRIYGRNSMVKVSDEVMCLGFLDGGKNTRNPIVIGGYQLEDVLVQIDFDTSMVGFSSSLLMKHTSCSDFNQGYMPAAEK